MVKYKNIILTIDSYNKSKNGTELPKPVRNQLNKFIKEYADDLEREHLGIYKNNGEPALDIVHGEEREVTVPIFKLITMKLKNLHEIHNHPTVLDDGVPTVPTKTDCKSFLEKGYGDEYLFRSTTVTTPYSHRQTTLIRNNDFSDKDIPKYNRATSKMIRKWKEYRSEFYRAINSAEINIITEKMGRPATEADLIEGKFHKEAVEVGLKEVGDLKQYFKREGVLRDFERCNMKLRII